MKAPHRKSHAIPGIIYYWTATIHKWHHLLREVDNKRILLQHLKKLSDEGFITVYAFVVMPNHIHLIWKQNKLNGKETPFGSFLKHTSHQFLKKLKLKGEAGKYKIEASNKEYEIWRRDSLAIEIYSKEVAIQKLRYIHANPVTGIWRLAKDDISYYYSSAMFYETGLNDFDFLKDLFAVFDGN
jgi:putative transposase